MLRKWTCGGSELDTHVAGRLLGRGVRRAQGRPGEEPLQSLAAASDKLTADFGTWKTPWGEINRFQRLNGDIAPRFDDRGPSIPVASHPRSGLAGVIRSPRLPRTKRCMAAAGKLRAVWSSARPCGQAVTAAGVSGHPAPRTLTMKPRGTPRATCGRFTSIARNSRAHRAGVHPGSEGPRYGSSTSITVTSGKAQA